MNLLLLTQKYIKLYTLSADCNFKKGKGSSCSITERRVLELIPVLGSQPAVDVNHKPDSVTLETLKRAATSFAAW